MYGVVSDDEPKVVEVVVVSSAEKDLASEHEWQRKMANTLIGLKQHAEAQRAAARVAVEPFVFDVASINNHCLNAFGLTLDCLIFFSSRCWRYLVKDDI